MNKSWRETLTAGLLVLFGLQSLRALFPSLVYVVKDRFGVSSPALGGIAFGLFAMAALGPWILQRGGRKAGTTLVVATIATRVALQLWPGDPLYFLALSAFGTLLFLWWIPTPIGGGALSVNAFLLGATLDTFFHAFYRTHDLHFRDGSADVVTLGLAGVLGLVTLRNSRAEVNGGDPAEIDAATNSPRVSPPPAALHFQGACPTLLPGACLLAGPFLFLHLEWWGNVARLSARTTLDTWAAGAALLACLGAAGIFGPLLARTRARSLVSASLPVLAFAANSPGTAALFILAGGWIAALGVLTLGQDAPFPAIAKENGPASGRGATPVHPTAQKQALFSGGGGVLFVALAFAHYAGYDLPLPWGRREVWTFAALLLAAGMWWTSRPLGAGRNNSAQQPLGARGIGRSGSSSAFAIGALPAFVGALVLLCASRFLPATDLLDDPARTPAARDPATVLAAPASEALRVVTFNLHAGYDERGDFAFSTMMDSLRAVDADLIALQEVSRGWLINGCADLYELARASLGSSSAFGPSVGGDWGNAVFSTRGLGLVENIELPPRSLSLTRAALATEIPAATVAALGAPAATGPGASGTTSGAPGAAFSRPPLHFVATHFHHRADDENIREEHAAFLVERLSPEAGLLLGDFNALPASASLRLLERAGWRDVGTADSTATPPIPPGEFTYPSRAPVRRIDTILVRGASLHLQSTRVLPAWGSDHRAVMAEFRFLEERISSAESPHQSVATGEPKEASPPNEQTNPR